MRGSGEHSFAYSIPLYGFATLAFQLAESIDVVHAETFSSTIVLWTPAHLSAIRGRRSFSFRAARPAQAFENDCFGSGSGKRLIPEKTEGLSNFSLDSSAQLADEKITDFRNRLSSARPVLLCQPARIVVSGFLAGQALSALLSLSDLAR
jgi:hypothetical protein